MTPSIVLIAVLATAVLSGVLGMAGGMVLMAVLVTVSPVATAMVVHGIAQATSNGARVWFLRRHVMWNVLPPYLIGGALATGLFVAVAFVPEPGLVLILVGASPWLARLVPFLHGLDIRERGTSVACGATVTAAQLLAGASGPLLDAFYLGTDTDRRQIVATKAVTQTVGHVVKIVYYGVIVGRLAGAAVEPVAGWLITGIVLLAILGARIGTAVLERLDTERFRRITTVAVLSLGAVCVIKGVSDLWID
ncbi:MAG: sulfite exporter TauE/SafE family protein [Gammaproteobacteria bacterium]|nr:sulfite exporter TauE/SafE family protein [Gammaproteobacteria bacterium]